MKTYFIIVALLFSVLGLAQSSKQNRTSVKVLYQLKFEKFDNSEKVKTENSTLIVNASRSFFCFDKMITLDSIQRKRPLNDVDVLNHRSDFYIVITRDSNLISHYESLGKDLFNFEESFNLKWKLVNQQKTINGYPCKKATLNFAGRDWVAWYTPELPLSAGPYKFYGLPGLILDISDTQELFRFTAYEVKKGDFNMYTDIKNLFYTEAGDQFKKINAAEFYKIRNQFNLMTLNERLKYMNRGEVGSPDFVITRPSGEKIRTNKKPKIRNFIELLNK